MYDINDWGHQMDGMISWFSPNARDSGTLEAIRPVDEVVGLAGRYSFLHHAPDSEVSPILNQLHQGLVTLANSLGRSIPRPAPLPAQHPPKFARLHEDASADGVSDRLTRLIGEGVELYEAAGKDSPPALGQGTRNCSRFEHALAPFLTEEVRQRYRVATGGFGNAELLATGQMGGHGEQRRREFREIAAGIAPRIHAAYVAIALNYLAEVLELMPDYADASGQGKRRDPVTVYGNVAAIHSQVNNSHISVADTVTSIGATINAVAARGEPGVAQAIRALSEAIQQAPELAEGQRAELLDHVADVADAAAAPDEPRRLARARAAMAMIATAAGASTQLAQAVNTWHQVAGQLF